MVNVVRFLLAGVVLASMLAGRVWTGSWIHAVDAADAQVVDRRGTSDRFADSLPAIVPHPQEVRPGQGTLHLPILRSIVLGRGTTDSDRFAAELIREELERLDVGVTIDHEGPETVDSASISIRRASNLQDDAYRLNISREGAVIEAGSERGRFYGAMSLLQIVRTEGGRVPSLHVFDYPDLAVRGLMDDLVYQIPKLEEFKRIIRFLGEHKMNTYVLPVEGLFRFGVDPTAGMGTVSVEELIELQDYAASYHVELIPALRTLGQFERLLRLPEFDDLAEYPGAPTLNTQDSAAYELVGRLLDEIVPVFRSDYVHIDGRWSEDVGIGASADAVDSLGARAVHLRHYRRVAELVHSRGKQVMIDGDDLLVPDRGGKSDDGRAGTFSFADVVVADAQRLSSLRDRSSATSTVLSKSDVRPTDRVFPDLSAAWSRLSRSAGLADAAGAAGLLAAVRTRDDAPLLRAMQRREYAYAADRTWNTDPVTADVDRRINRVFYGYDDAEMQRLTDAIGDMTEEIVFPSVWRHPLHHAPSVGAVVELSTVPPATDSRRDAEMLLTDIEYLQTLVTRNAQQLDYYAFAVRFSAWFQDTQALASWMMEARRTDSERSTLDRGALWARALTGEGRALAQAYRSLWLRSNRDVHLDRALSAFQYQVGYMERTAETLEEGSWDVKTTIPSRFVGAHDGASRTHLRKTFVLERGQVEVAYLQVAGRNDVTVWLNGDRLGRSVGPEWSRVDVWNVAPRLRSGENVLAAEVAYRGLDAEGAALANMYLEVRFQDGSRRSVETDRTWKASSAASMGWQRSAFSDASWQQAITPATTRILTAPLFDRDLPSKYERVPP